MSDHPHDQLGLHTPGSDSASSTVHIRRRDKFCKLWGISKSQPKEITESLDFRPLSQQSTQPPSAVSLVSNHPSDDNQSFASSGVQDKPLPLPPSEAQHLADIFADNLPKPIVKADLPCLQERIERTEQLVFIVSSRNCYREGGS
ncbi:hypothetical protein BKA57DRAFT_442012 [Linnemannia elongata]|nr:hypothetical protein BKA57DRAFT_442012 [Linnemannia elongata]